MRSRYEYLFASAWRDGLESGRASAGTYGYTSESKRKNADRHAAEALAGLDSGIDRILSSPLSRARESAVIVADRLAYEKEKIVVEPLLTERCFGEGEGLTAAGRTEKYPDNFYPGMESYEDLIIRAHSVFEKIVTSFADAGNILVVAHGAILYAIVTAITDGEIVYGGKTVQFDQGSIHVIRYSNGGMKLAKYCEDVSSFVDIRFG